MLATKITNVGDVPLDVKGISHKNRIKRSSYFLTIISLTIENDSIKCYFKIYSLEIQKGGKGRDEE